MQTKIKSYVVHYAYGLFAAGWNGAWNAVAGILGIDAAAMTGASANARILNAREMAAAFIGAFIIHGIVWLKSHPIPSELTDSP